MILSLIVIWNMYNDTIPLLREPGVTSITDLHTKTPFFFVPMVSTSTATSIIHSVQAKYSSLSTITINNETSKQRVSSRILIKLTLSGVNLFWSFRRHKNTLHFYARKILIAKKIASHKLIERTIYVARVCYCNPTLLVHFECEFHYCSVAFYYRIHNSQMLGHLNKKNQFELGSILFNLRWFNAFFSSFIYIYIFHSMGKSACCRILFVCHFIV